MSRTFGAVIIGDEILSGKRQDKHFARIADMLGYSIPSSFTLWFIAQFGMPPASWRAQHGVVPRK